MVSRVSEIHNLELGSLGSPDSSPGQGMGLATTE